MKKFLIVVAALIVAFGAGYVPQYLKSGRLTGELQQSQEQFEERINDLETRNRILSLHSQLGMLLLEVENQNYGSARERSTAWFDELRHVTSGSTDESMNQRLNSIGDNRDALTALLTEANPEAVATLREMYRSLAEVAGVR